MHSSISSFFKDLSMARKVTPLYAETLVLLNLWALDKTPAAPSKFISSTKEPVYKKALEQLAKEGSLVAEMPKGKRYEITEDGKFKLAKSLGNKGFSFISNAGPKTTNALLKWFRQNAISPQVSSTDTSSSQDSHNNNGNGAKISSYKDFTKTALATYDQLNQDYNLGDLVPIYRIRREIGDRLLRREFNEWLLKIQSDELVQLMGGELPNVTPEQLEDSVTIPGGGTRLYVKRL
jgi:DNA-binding PadR family transcriptional regulator